MDAVDLSKMGSSTLGEVRDSLAQDSEWGEAKLETLRQQVQKRRAADASKRLQRDTTRRQKRRLQRESQERAILELIKQMESSKEDEMRIALEKERISRELRNVPATELSATEMSKKRDLQRLAKELEAIRAREAQVAEQVDGIERSIAEQQQGVEDKRIALAAARQRRSGAAAMQGASAIAGRAGLEASMLDPSTRLAQQALLQGERHARHVDARARLETERAAIDASQRKLAARKLRVTGRGGAVPEVSDAQGGGAPLDAIIQSVQKSMGAQTARVNALRAAHETSVATRSNLGHDDFSDAAHASLIATVEARVSPTAFTMRRAAGGARGDASSDYAAVTAVAVAHAAALSARTVAREVAHAPQHALSVRMGISQSGGAGWGVSGAGNSVTLGSFGAPVVQLNQLAGAANVALQQSQLLAQQSAEGDESLRRELHALQSELANQQKTSLLAQQQQLVQQQHDLAERQHHSRSSPRREYHHHDDAGEARRLREEQRHAEETRRREEQAARREEDERKEETRERAARAREQREQRERERQWQSTLQRQMQEMMSAEERQNVALQRQLAAEETKQIELDALEATGLQRRQQQFALREQLIGRGGGGSSTLPFTSMSTALATVASANAGKKTGGGAAASAPEAASFGECVSSIAATAGACALLETVDPSSELYRVQVDQVKDLANVRFAMEKMQAEHYRARLAQQLAVEQERMELKARQQTLELRKQSVLLYRDEAKVEKALAKMQKRTAKEAYAPPVPRAADVRESTPLASPSPPPTAKASVAKVRAGFGVDAVVMAKSRAHRRILASRKLASAIPSPGAEKVKSSPGAGDASPKEADDEDTTAGAPAEKEEETKAESSAAEQPAAEEEEGEAAQSVSLRLKGKLNKKVHTSKKFHDEFIADLAKAAGVPADRFKVLSVRSGSIIVEFAVLPAAHGGSSDAANVEAIMANLKSQMKSKKSKLRKGRHTKTLDPKHPFEGGKMEQPKAKKTKEKETKEKEKDEGSPNKSDEDVAKEGSGDEAEEDADAEEGAAAAATDDEEEEEAEQVPPTIESAGSLGILLDRIVTKADAGGILHATVEVEYTVPTSGGGGGKKKKKKTPAKKKHKELFTVKLRRESDEPGAAPKKKKKKKKKADGDVEADAPIPEGGDFAADPIADEGAGWYAYTAAECAVWEWQAAGINAALFAQGAVRIIVRCHRSRRRLSAAHYSCISTPPRSKGLALIRYFLPSLHTQISRSPGQHCGRRQRGRYGLSRRVHREDCSPTEAPPRVCALRHEQRRERCWQWQQRSGATLLRHAV
jgi:hypothetical protein